MIWQYATVQIDRLSQREIDNLFNDLGSDLPVGWELVGVSNDLAYFKRPDIRAMEKRNQQLNANRKRRRISQAKEAIF